MKILSCIIFIGIIFSWYLVYHRYITMNHQSLTYIALWDSYTIGEWVRQDERWPDMLVSRFQSSGVDIALIANPSVTGYTTLDLIKYELPLIEQYHPDFITVQIGVNDYFRWVTLSEFRTRFEYILKEIRRIAPDAQILIVDIPDYGMTPTGKRTGDPTTIQKGIIQYHQAIRELAKPYSISVVDVLSVSLLVSGDPSLVASDGLHPSGKQYALWVDAIFSIAKEIF